jgi:hypothetical protein
MHRAPYRPMIWALAALVALGSRLAAQTVEERGPQEAPKPAEGAPAKVDSASEEPKPGKISGYIFGDYYYFPRHRDAKFDGQNGFWFRRVYLSYDRDLGTAWTSRVRLELNSPSLQEPQDRLRPYLKDAYLRWTKGSHSLLFGLSPSPTLDLVEGFWGFRHLEKTALDLHRWADSRDTGLAAKGTFDKGKKFGYHAMVGTGTGTRNEVDKDKRVYLALSVRPAKGWVFEAYGDWENRRADTDLATFQVFGGREGQRAKVGVQFAHQKRQQGPAKDDLELDILSIWVTGRISSKTMWVVRVDRGFDPDPSGASIAYLPFDERSKSTFVLGGLDYLPIPSVHITPNVEVVTYDGSSGSKPETDVVARLTMFWTF